MNNLFICNTPYQVLVALQIIENNVNDNNTICCSTIMNQPEKVVNNLNKIYDSFVWNINQFNSNFQRIKYLFLKKKGLKKIGFPESRIQQFDCIYISNLSVENYIVYLLLKKINHKIKLVLFEDGLSTYSKLYYKKIYKSRIKWYKVISEIKVFNPKMIDWNCTINLSDISCSFNNNDFVEKVNEIFDYKQLDDKYEDYKYIFFEEGYSSENINIFDLEFVDYISSKVGKKSIFIKRHPRCKNNRFGELGYITNKNTSIPWEIIALNIDLSDKILLTCSSQSVFTTIALLGVETTSVMYFKSLDDRSMLYPFVSEYIEKKAKYFNNIVLLKNFNEVFMALNINKNNL